MDVTPQVRALIAGVENLPQELVAALRTADNTIFLSQLSQHALLPQYTQTIFACFEPLALELCTRWSNGPDPATVAAFGRVLDLYPRLKEVALHKLRGSSNAKVDLLACLAQEDIRNSPDSTRELLTALVRLLTIDDHAFAPCLQPARLQLLLSHEDRVVRYLAIRVLTLYLHASDAAFQNMVRKYLGRDEISGTWEGKLIDYRFWTLWEDRRREGFRSLQQSMKNNVTSPPHIPSRILADEDLSPMTVRITDTLFSSSEALPSKVPRSEFVSTPTTNANLTSFAHALATPDPILLTGLAGSGKTHIMNHVSRCLGRSDSMITLHLNEQSDAKLLIGIYATGSEPGSFEWRPGVLTTAVQEGRWVFIEDIDRAPIDVLSTIIPLIERREINIPSRGQTIRAASNFRVFATARTLINLDGQEQVAQSRMPGRRLWKNVSVIPMNTDDLRIIIQQRFPSLTLHLPRITAAFEATQNALKHNASGSRRQTRQARSVTSRELFKWCERLHAASAHKNVEERRFITEEAFDYIFLDAYDCFAGYLDHPEDRMQVASAIAKELHIGPQRRDHLLSARTIALNQTSSGANKIFTVGRATLRSQRVKGKPSANNNSSPFAANRHILRTLECIAVSVKQGEPVLLVGETGIGKTTAIQHLAAVLDRQLIAINLSQQSESSDLLGGFKPLNSSTFAIPLKDEFDTLFEKSFSRKKNQEFIQRLSKCVARKQWAKCILLWRTAFQMVEKSLEQKKLLKDGQDGAQQAKRRKLESDAETIDISAWDQFRSKLDSFESQVGKSSDSSMIFSFVEGKLVNAVREGHWVLLDEINLATPDTLECLSELLETGADAEPSLILAETGQTERIKAHPNFRIFAAMNPSTDVGKRDLPQGIKSRFTEFYVNSPDQDIQSLQVIVGAYLHDKKLSNTVAKLYIDIQTATKEQGLVDGSNQPPVFSLRTLTRALSHARSITSQYSLKRAIFEGFALCFFTSLDQRSEAVLVEIVQQKLFGSTQLAKAEMKRSPKPPEAISRYFEVNLRVRGIGVGAKDRDERSWLPRGDQEPQDPDSYIITPYISKNLQNLIRAASTRKYPVLIQGPTSAGKTSMVEYLAKRSGNVFVRINNHEHTDLQEYLGTYVSTAEGKIVFQEGVLVEALRKGYWVVLDELNLAPTDVLEALNRLLDDNRELLVPETQEVVRPHSNFMLFATQNPAGPYGGRKVLSRAFRNRFVELHFDDIPIDELNVILARRSNLPETWCGLIVKVYKELSRLRQTSRIFEQNGFVTLRDLFRWAFRGADSVEDLAMQGYMLLGEKVRTHEEREEVKKVLQSVMTRKGTVVRIDEDRLYGSDPHGYIKKFDESSDDAIVWTRAMRRLYVLVSEAIRHNEAVLLVGETGCGKTTVCQMIAHAFQQELHIINAHQNLETGDLIGAQRPRRNRAAVEIQLQEQMLHALSACGRTDLATNLTVDELANILQCLNTEEAKSIPPQISSNIKALKAKANALFEWQDGSIVKAMKTGELFLLDEISLADDSVLERLNSVLDPQRSILLAEKGTDGAYVTAASGFQFFATMNPGGDYGKKELSPALRNRFTEIWVPTMSSDEDLLHIVRTKLKQSAKSHAHTLVEFGKRFEAKYRSLKESLVSLRDMLAWIDFINASSLPEVAAIIEGAHLVYIDSLGANPSAMLAMGASNLHEEKSHCLDVICRLLSVSSPESYAPMCRQVVFTSDVVRFGDFEIARHHSAVEDSISFSFNAPTTRQNAHRIARGLQLRKPLLLEGNPGVGKTSIVNALAKAVGKPLVRLNLSEQTDLMDLFGSDAPVEGASAGVFAWRDAPFLSAMKRGEWVLLDEMNLASQSVLEGLNACLDHRAEVYIPELEQTFHRHPDFRLFAAQNPHAQGGGRKGLPASFVNRFTVIHMDVLEHEDLLTICKNAAPQVDDAVLNQLITFVTSLDEAVVTQRKFGFRGAPWEFNLRDCLRCLQLITTTGDILGDGHLSLAIDMLFLQRFRTSNDRKELLRLAETMLSVDALTRSLYTNLTPTTFQVGSALIQRSSFRAGSGQFRRLQASGGLRTLECMAVCGAQNWPVLLIGPSGSGKTSLIKSLASVSGVDVEVFSLSADIDASDLVGGYEQLDGSRHEYHFKDKLQQCLEDIVIGMLSADAVDLAKLRNLLLLVSEAATTNMERLLAYLRQEDLTRISEVGQLCAEYEQAIIDVPHAGKARFEWVDGTLIKALEQGKWLVLDNANLCSPSVLDRLNSLLETGGSLIINEHCNSDGSPKVIRPHPDFRLFMTMDPQYGEISRAMRNRAVELFITAEIHAADHHEGQVIQAEGVLDSSVARFDSLVKLSQFTEIENDTFDRALNEVTDHISFEDVRILQSFIQQIEIGLISRDSTHSQMCLRACQNMLQTATSQEAWYQKPLACYRSLLGSVEVPEEFTLHQPLHMLVNEPLTSPSNTEQRQALALTHETLRKLNLLGDKIMEHTGSSLKRSAKKKDPRIKYQTLLENMLSAVGDWIVKDWDRAPQNFSVAKLLVFLFSLWSSLQAALHQDQSSLVLLEAYLRHGRKTLASLSEADQLASLPRSLVGQIDNLAILQPFRSGIYMVDIWNLVRPTSPCSSQQLASFSHLQNISQKFDHYAHSLNVRLADLFPMRQALLRAFQICQSQVGHSDREMQMLPQTPFDDIAGPSAVAETQPVFQRTANRIHQRLCLTSASEKEIADSGPLGLLSTISTQTLHNLLASSGPGASLQRLSTFLDVLPQDGRLKSATRVILDDISLLNSAEMHRLERIRDELSTVGQVSAGHQRLLGADDHRLLASNVLDLVESLLSISNLLDRTSTDQLLQARASLAALRESVDSLSARIDLGHVMITVGILCIVLYTPDRAFDPAMAGVVAQDLHDSQVRHIQGRIITLKAMERRMTGNMTNLRSKILESQVKSLGQYKDTQGHIYRPQVSLVGQLSPYFANALRIAERLASMAKHDQISTVQQEIEDDLHQLIERLGSFDLAYRDITVPLTGFINCIRLGARLKAAAEGQVEKSAISISDLVLRAIPLLGNNTTLIESGLIFDASLQHRPTLKEGIQLMTLTAFERQTLSKSSTEKLAQSQAEAVSVALSTFYHHWKEQLKRDQKAAEQASSTFTYRGGEEDDFNPDDDELDAMFGMTEKPSSDATTPDSLSGSSPQELARLIASHHLAIFSETTSSPDILRKLHSLAADTATSSDEGQTLTSYEHSAEMYLRLCERKKDMMETSHRQDYNIFTDANVSEVSNIVQVLVRIQSRTEQIQSIWPEHATLQNILDACREIREMPWTEPLMKILPSIEKLHATLVQWQSVASREFSLAEWADRITQTIVSWRRLELSTWSSLLDVEERKLVDQAQEWWFPIYENLFLAPLSQKTVDEARLHLPELLAALEDFLGGTTVGQFEHRLRLVRSLHCHLLSMSAVSSRTMIIANAVKNVINDMDRSVGPAQAAIAEKKRDLSKELKDVILLASWKDTNVEALKQSSRVSHRKLFRIVRKFQAFVNKPVQPVIAAAQSSSLSNETGVPSCEVGPGIVLPATVPPKIRTACETDERLWSARPTRYKHTSATLNMMHGKLSGIVPVLNSHLPWQEFVSDTVTTAQELRKATPSTLTEENTALAKHLTARKRRLFVDTLKELRRLGLSSNQTPATLERQSSKAKILAILPNQESELAQLTEFKHPLPTYQVLDILPQIRVAVKEVHDDLTHDDMARSIGLFEGLLALGIDATKNAFNHHSVHYTLQQTLDRFQNTWQDDQVSCSPQMPPQDRSALTNRACRLVVPILQLAARVIQSQAYLGGPDLAPLVGSLNQLSDSFKALAARQSQLLAVPERLESEQSLTLSESIEHAFNDLERTVVQSIAIFPQAELTLTHLLRWTRLDAGLVDQKLLGAAVQGSSLSNVNDAVYRCLDTCLSVAQDVEKTTQDVAPSFEDDKWLLKTTLVQRSLLAAFNSQSILQQCEDLAIKLSSLQDTGELHAAIVSIQMGLPILQLYSNAYQAAIAQAKAFSDCLWSSQAQLGRLLCAISTQGFCKPSEASDEKGEQSDKLEGGTGLGEGEGAENISKEIGDDEDLSELAQEESTDKTQDQQDGDDNNDAVDVDDDLKNAMGEEEAQEGEEQDEKPEDQGGEDNQGGNEDMRDDTNAEGTEAQDEGGEDMDEGVGDVDDFEPSALDEKMWDEAGDEGDGEKESKQDAKSKSDEQAASKDGQKSESDNGDAEDANDAENADETDASDAEDEHDRDGVEEKGAMDPHVQEAENLDLPEDMQLDGDKEDEAGNDETGSDIDMLDQVDADAPDEDAQPGAEEHMGPEMEQVDEAMEEAGEEGEENAPLEDDTTAATNANDNDGGMDDTEEDTAGGTDATVGGKQSKQAQEDIDADKPEDADDQEAADTADDAQEGAQSAKQAQGPSKASQPDPAPPESKDHEQIKKLGDMLERWHRQNREIQDASEDRGQEQQQDVDMADADFEHLPDEEAKADTQALGASTLEQARAMDQDNSILPPDEDKAEQPETFQPEEVTSDDEEMDDVKADPSSAAATADDQDSKQPSHVHNQPPTDEEVDAASDSDDEEFSTPPVSLKSLDADQQDVLQPWQHYEQKTHPHTLTLLEQLRQILAPTLATKLRGDFRTGKRLNIKRIIPFIASGYKRDKIWLRRSLPSKRAYQVLLALDDSKSMAGSAAHLAFETLALVARSLSMLEVGEIGVLGFGASVFEAHKLGQPFTSDAGANAIRSFGFKQGQTDVKALLRASIERFAEARLTARGDAADLWQLELIVSDGFCSDHEEIRKLLLRAQEARIMVIFVVVVDGGGSASTPASSAPTSAGAGVISTPAPSKSILELESITFSEPAMDADGRMSAPKVTRRRYLDSFPFRYYLIVRRVEDLPGVLSQALRQWFAEVSTL